MSNSLWFHFKTKLIWPLGFRLRKLFSKDALSHRVKAYSFDHARKYWKNVPRAKGDRALNSGDLKKMPTLELAQLFDREQAKIFDKTERRQGMELAYQVIRQKEAPRILDYGSGFGLYGVELAKSHPKAIVYCADINPDNLEVIGRIAGVKNLQHRIKTLLVEDEQAAKLKVPEGLDLILSMGVLHHTPYAPQIVRHLSKFLKPAGIFQVMLYNHKYHEVMSKVSGEELDSFGFGAFTDPVKSGLANPYSDAYNDEETDCLFAGYKRIAAHHPEPFYNIYQYRKI